MWEFFIKNSKFSYLLLLALIGVGAYSAISIPKESSPEVQIPIGVVTTVLPGASALDVESLITDEIEKGLSGSLENVKNITSSSQEGVSSVVVEFDASADIDASIADLKDSVDRIKQELPNEAEDPFVTEVNFVDQPIMTIAVSGDLSDFGFIQVADDLENAIEKIQGVSRLESQGVQQREISILVDQTALSNYSLTIGDITNAVRTANQSLPVGKIESDKVLYNVAFEGDITNSAEIQNIAVATNDGQPVYVRDVATVTEGLTAANTLTRLSVDGTPSQQAVSFLVYKQRGGDITTITDSVVSTLESLHAEGGVLSNLESNVVLNSGDDIKKSLSQLTGSGLQTVLLVVLVLILALGWREGLVAGTAIPLSFLFGFIGLYFSGNTINFLSLFALILGIGVLVDSAIVMVEGINRRMKDEPTIDKTEAALLTIREFSSPLISGTLTTVAMFTGLFIVSGVTGQFIAVIPFTLVFVLFASLLVALGIVPLIASVFLKRRNASNFEKKQVQYAHTLEEWYRHKLEKIIGYKKNERIFMWGIRIALILALLLPVTGVVKVVFFEQSDVDYLIVEVELPEGSIKETTDIAVRRVEEVLYKNSDVESFLTTVGAGNDFASGGVNEKVANVFITLAKDRSAISTTVLEKIRSDLAFVDDVKVTVTQPSDGPPTGSPIGLTFTGTDLTELTQVANESAELLKSIPGATNVTTSANANSTEFVLKLDTLKASAYGLNPLGISSILRTVVYGTEATSLTTTEDDVNVIVKLNVSGDTNLSPDTANQMSIDALNRINVTTPSGRTLPLSSLVTTSLRESSAVINHKDSKRVVTLSGDITGDGNALEIQTALMDRIDSELFVSDDVTITIGGETEDTNQSFIELFLALVVGIVLMLAVLVLQFNSYLHTRYVLSILPYSLIGIMVGLAVTGNALSFPSIMGFIALSGIVVNNSILLIDMMNTDRKRNPTKDIRSVVIDSAVSRLRPILLTTITTVIGMVPLIYTGDLWAPLAYAVMFGLLFSVVITLVLVPIAYNKKPGALG